MIKFLLEQRENTDKGIIILLSTHTYLTSGWFNCLVSQLINSGTEEVGSCCKILGLTLVRALYYISV
jgi:hypothetical protein